MEATSWLMWMVVSSSLLSLCHVTSLILWDKEAITILFINEVVM